MGAWTFIEPNIEWVLDKIEAKHTASALCRPRASAATATGLMSKAPAELNAFLDEALGRIILNPA
jgi:2-oxoglutarate dehydrogenase E1 component